MSNGFHNFFLCFFLLNLFFLSVEARNNPASVIHWRHGINLPARYFLELQLPANHVTFEAVLKSTLRTL
jgi:hypothetical protein